MSLLLLTACGGQSTEPVGKIDTDTPQVEQSDTAPDAVETPDEADAPNETIIWTLDTIPAPVMTGTIGSDQFSEDENMVTYIARYGVEHDVGVSELETYLTALTDAGFVFDVSCNNEGKSKKYYEYMASATNSNATVEIEFEWYQFDPNINNADDTETAAFRVFVYIE